MPTYRNISGTWRASIPWRKIGGTWKSCVLWRNIGGVWKVVGGQVTAVASPSAVSGAGPGTPSTVVSNTSTVTPSGGVAPYTYDWEYVSGDAAISVDADTSATTSWRKVLAAGALASATWRCKVTDSTGQIGYSNNVLIELENL